MTSQMETDIEEFKNEYQGERIFLIGNGPSLDETPLDKMNNEYTLGLNRVDHIYGETEWRPSFYLTPWSLERLKREKRESGDDFVNTNKELGIPCFIRSGLSDNISGDNIYFFDSFKLRCEYIPFHDKGIEYISKVPVRHLYEYWSDDVSVVLYEYHAMYVAAQLATYMGFSEIYFVGTDLGMQYKNPHMIFKSGLDPHRYSDGKSNYILESLEKSIFTKSMANAILMKIIKTVGDNQFLKSILSPSENSDHFTSDYAPELEIRDRKKVENEIRKAHVATKRICEDHGIEVYNATIGGELEVYPRVDIYDIIS